MDKNYSKVVTSSFVRVMKRHNKYNHFIERFNQMSKNAHGDNPFSGMRDIYQLMDKLHSISIKQYNENSRKDGKYEFITICVNNLLRFIGENLPFEKKDLGMIGQEIFDIACCQLFGSEYEKDMDKINNGAPRPRNSDEAMLVGEFMGLVHSGRNITWEQYLSAKGINRKHNLFPESFPIEDDDYIFNVDELVDQFFIVNNNIF